MRRALARVLAKNAVRSAIASVAISALDLATQLGAAVIIARHLGAEVLGTWSLAFAVAGAIAVVALFGTGEISIQAYARGHEPPARVLAASLGVWVLGSSCCVLLSVVGAVLLRLDAMGLMFLAAATSSLIGNALSSVYYQALLGKAVVNHDVKNAIASKLLMLVLACVGAITTHLWLMAAAFPIGAFSLALLRRGAVTRHVSDARVWPDVRAGFALARISRSLLLSSVFGSISSRADMFLLKRLTSTVDVGWYSAAYRLLNGALAVATAAAVATFPSIVQHEKAHGLRSAIKRIAPLPLLLVAACLIGAALAPYVVAVLYGDAFTQTSGLLRILLVAGAASCTQAFIAKLIIVAGQAQLLWRSQLVAAVSNIAANAVLIPRMGVDGAAWSTCIAEFTLLLLNSLLLWRTARANNAR